MKTDSTRREILRDGGLVFTTAAAGLLSAKAWGRQEKEPPEPEVTATEDMMREHGVIRRALLVYAQLADQLRKAPGAVDAAALHKTAQLFRTFGEDYHERMLEKQHIFPIVRKMKGEAAKYPDILIAQHQRGRGNYGLRPGGYECSQDQRQSRRAFGSCAGGLRSDV